LYLYEGNDFLSDIEGKVIAVQYYCKQWRGKVKLKKKNKDIMLTEDWVEANFYKEFVEQWRNRQGIWNKVVLGCPKIYEMESNSVHPSIHANLKVKFPQAHVCCHLLHHV